LKTSLLGRTYDLPFGVAPVGLSGLIWPHASEILAQAARSANIPFCLSTFANPSLETIAEIAPDHVWFQHFATKQADIESDILERARSAGYDTLVVTVDIPTAGKRERDIRNGLSDPVVLRPTTFLQCLLKPRWALATIRAGVPEFANLARYAPAKATPAELEKFFGSLVEGHVTGERLADLRQSWNGKLVVKGVLDAADAKICRQVGADAIVLSNHGGRQLDAAPTAPDVIGTIREVAGDRMAIIADGGVRSGLDVARLLAAGAQFVLLGRAFLFGVAALGHRGGDYVVDVLHEELRSTLKQIGCRDVADLSEFYQRQ
jgi:L-lactate dehydrogenase (cytochrome)